VEDGAPQEKESDVVRGKRSRSLLLSQIIQSNRYRLLFLISSKGKIAATDGKKTVLRKTFGYQSESSFYNDWNFFIREGLIEEAQDWIYITSKGRREFLFLTALLAIAVLAFSYAIIFLITTWLGTESTYSVLRVLSPWFTGFVPWIVVAVISLYTFFVVRPRLSPQESSIQ